MFCLNFGFFAGFERPVSGNRAAPLRPKPYILELIFAAFASAVESRVAVIHDSGDQCPVSVRERLIGPLC